MLRALICTPCMSVLIRFLIYYDALSACAQSPLKLDVS